MAKELTEKQRAFVQSFFESENAVEAYKKTYSAKADASPGSLRVSASKVLNNPNVKAELDRIRARAAEKTVTTVADLVRELEEARQAALSAETPQASAAAAATMGKAKLLGMDKQVIDINQRISGSLTLVTPEKRQARIDELLLKIKKP